MRMTIFLEFRRFVVSNIIYFRNYTLHTLPTGLKKLLCLIFFLQIEFTINGPSNFFYILFLAFNILTLSSFSLIDVTLKHIF